MTLVKTDKPKQFELKLGSDVLFKPLDFVNTGKFLVWHSGDKVFSLHILSLIKTLD